MSQQPDTGVWPTDDLPDNWIWVSFNDFWINNTDSTKKLPQKEYSQIGSIPVIDQGQDLIGGYSDQEELLSNTSLPCIVWGDHTKCVKFVDFPFIQGADGVKVISPTELIIPKFGFWTLKTITIPDKGYSRHFKFLSSSKFPLPPLSEQRRIVAKLDALFARTRQAREELEHIPALIEHYKQAILAAAFRGELTADWRKNYQQTDLPDVEANQGINGDKAFEAPFTIPTGWKWMPLPKLGKLGRGKSRHRPRNEPSLYGGPYPFVQTGEIRAADGFLATYTKTYSEIGLAQSKLWPVGTVCITIAANIAETAILGIEACFPDSVVGLITDDTICLNRYAEYFLRTVREELDAFAPATAQKNINLGTLSEVYMPLPPREEQDEIVRLVDELYDSISTISLDAEQAYRMLDYLERAVLAKAFRGELVPQDPDDEPASVLLERIRAARAEQSNGNQRQKRK